MTARLILSPSKGSRQIFRASELVGRPIKRRKAKVLGMAVRALVNWAGFKRGRVYMGFIYPDARAPMGKSLFVVGADGPVAVDHAFFRPVAERHSRTYPYVLRHDFDGRPGKAVDDFGWEIPVDVAAERARRAVA